MASISVLKAFSIVKMPVLETFSTASNPLEHLFQINHNLFEVTCNRVSKSQKQLPRLTTHAKPPSSRESKQKIKLPYE